MTEPPGVSGEPALVRVVYVVPGRPIEILRLDIARPEVIYGLVNGCRDILALDELGIAPLRAHGRWPGPGPLLVVAVAPDGAWSDIADELLEPLLAALREATAPWAC